MPTAEFPEGKYCSYPEKNLADSPCQGIAGTQARFDGVFLVLGEVSK